MTRDEILKLEGRELDKAVAEMVYGAGVTQFNGHHVVTIPGEMYTTSLENYHKSIYAAHEAREKVYERWGVWVSLHKVDGKYFAAADVLDQGEYYTHWSELCQSAPGAICKACLMVAVTC